MSQRRHNVVRFRRSTRKHPKWHMGQPPGSKQRNSLDPRRYLKGAIAVSFAGLLGLQVAPDAATFTLSPAHEGGCRVVSIVDGDTLRLHCRHRGLVRARLVGFDTPEVFSPKCAYEAWRGQAATWELRKLLIGAKKATYVFHGLDRYGRSLVAVYLDGKSLALSMVRSGHAVEYMGGSRKNWCNEARA